MENELYNFIWDVSEDGYEWLDLEKPIASNDIVSVPHITANYVRTYADESLSPEDRRLIKGLEKRNKARARRRYNPLEFPDLYLEFANTPLTQDGIMAFATKYGLLGSDRYFGGWETIKVTDTVNYQTYAESIDAWCSEIIEMRRCVELWIAVCSGEDHELAHRIYWSDDGSVLFKSFDSLDKPEGQPYTWAYIAHSRNPADRKKFSVLERGELKRPAFMHLQKVINDKLQQNVTLRLLWDRHWTELGLHWRPDDLLSAMWLQFSQGIAEQRTLKRCVVCRKPFTVDRKLGSRSDKRSDKRYCSGACRVKASRQRRKSAAQN